MRPMADSLVDGTTLPARMYTDFASWFHLLTAPADYAEEAAFYWNAICSAGSAPPRTLLELGSGGGNNASHLKAHLQSYARRPVAPDARPEPVDQPGVRAHRRRYAHRSAGAAFDAVFIHDAICYMLTEADLAQAIRVRLRPLQAGRGGALRADDVRDVHDSTDHGGHDGAGRAMRYLEWTWDPTRRLDLPYGFRLLAPRREGRGPRRDGPARARALCPRGLAADHRRGTGFEPRASPSCTARSSPESRCFLGSSRARPKEITWIYYEQGNWGPRFGFRHVEQRPWQTKTSRWNGSRSMGSL